MFLLKNIEKDKFRLISGGGNIVSPPPYLKIKIMSEALTIEMLNERIGVVKNQIIECNKQSFRLTEFLHNINEEMEDNKNLKLKLEIEKQKINEQIQTLQ